MVAIETPSRLATNAALESDTVRKTPRGKSELGAKAALERLTGAEVDEGIEMGDVAVEDDVTADVVAMSVEEGEKRGRMLRSSASSDERECNREDLK